MAAFTPFEVDVKASVAGFTQTIVVGTINQAQQLVFNQPAANTVLVTGLNRNPAGGVTGVPYVRMSVESSTGAATAVSNTDTPFPLVPGAGPTVRLFAAPATGSQYVITVTSTISSTVANAWQLWFTPGEGGVE